ncbi:MAG TPA: hypothetical protein DD723_03405 [Candidatus Omnitrophica bacterium]|nr:MAG: hypothetical protein A2Z81_00870 [Omnitrophica WOR_2 bacterium GWA2_45_18]HBR14577.1 hypothetical protein [Candidatus Omnitrophota bacterium]
MNALETEYVVFDVETTGLFPLKGDRIVEIAAVKIKCFETVDVFDSLINPRRALSAHAMQVNQITEEMIASAPTADEVLPKMIDFIGGACLVGHNIKFDLDFLCYELSLMGRKLRDETPAIDTLKMAKTLLPHIHNHKLSNVAHFLGVRVDETHRAMADVKLTVSMMKRLLNIAGKQKIETFQQIHKHYSIQKPSFKIELAIQGSLFAF